MKARQEGTRPRGARAGSGHVLDRRQSSLRQRQLGLIILQVLQLASEIVHIRLHVEVAVSAEIEQDGTGSTFGLALERLLDCTLYCVVRLGRRQDPLGAGEQYTRGE